MNFSPNAEAFGMRMTKYIALILIILLSTGCSAASHDDLPDDDTPSGEQPLVARFGCWPSVIRSWNGMPQSN